MERKSINKVSTKQAKLNAEIAKLKAKEPKTCAICGGYCMVGEAMHLLPKSIFPKYYIEPMNVRRAHSECHEKFDNDLKFRQEQTHLISMCRNFATKEEIYRYFGV